MSGIRMRHFFKQFGLNVPKTGTFRGPFSGDGPGQLRYEEHARIALDRCCRSCHVHGAGLRAVGCPNRAFEQSRRSHCQLRARFRPAGAAERTPAGRARTDGFPGRLDPSLAFTGRLHYSRAIPKGIRAWSPGDRRRAEAAPIVGTRLFRLRSTLHALWRAVWGLPQGGAGPVPVDQPCTVCRLSLGRGRGRFHTC